MGNIERREKEKEIRRIDIIDAAERVFFAKGYDTATMDDVAKAAEFSKRTVYIYFNSKEQIYFAIMTRGYRLMIQMLEEDAKNQTGKNAIEEIQQMSLTLYRFSQEFTHYFKAIMEYENGALDFQTGVPDEEKEVCYALGEKVMRKLIDLLAKGIAEGSIRSDIDTEKTAVVLWAFMIGAFNTARKKENYIKNYYRMEPEDLITTSFRLITQAIQSDNGRILL